MYEDKTGRRNSEGYADPTAAGFEEAQMEEGRERCRLCVRAMIAVAGAMGCDVIERIAIRHRGTGYVSR